MLENLPWEQIGGGAGFITMFLIGAKYYFTASDRAITILTEAITNSQNREASNEERFLSLERRYDALQQRFDELEDDHKRQRRFKHDMVDFAHSMMLERETVRTRASRDGCNNVVELLDTLDQTRRESPLFLTFQQLMDERER